MAIGDYEIRVVGGQHGSTAMVLRKTRLGAVDVIAAYGSGEAMALRELYKKLRKLQELVVEAGRLAVKMEVSDG